MLGSTKYEVKEPELADRAAGQRLAGAGCERENLVFILFMLYDIFPSIVATHIKR